MEIYVYFTLKIKCNKKEVGIKTWSKGYEIFLYSVWVYVIVIDTIKILTGFYLGRIG